MKRIKLDLKIEDLVSMKIGIPKMIGNFKNNQ